MEAWKHKAHSIIASECKASYLYSNQLPNGAFRAKHKPYNVPELAKSLIDCLNQDNEILAKALMLRYSLGLGYSDLI